MLELAAVALAYVAFALLHAADARRAPPWLARRRCGRCLRVAAACVSIASLRLWSRAENMSAAIICVLAAFSVVGMSFVILRPRFAHVLWPLAYVAPFIAIALCLGALPAS